MVHNFTNIIKAKHHLSLQLIALHMTLAFLAWDLHENEVVLTLYRSYDPYMGHKRFFHCHAGKVGT